MADSELKLPGNFEAGRVYMVKGETLIAWRDALLADRVVAGDGIQESGTPQGRIFKAKGGSASLYHVINRLNVGMDGHVIMAEGDQYTMLFENGLLKWSWDSTGSDPEPAVPAGTPTVYSVNLTEVCA